MTELCETALISPSLHYFCSICRKELTNSVRIVAKTIGKNPNYFNFCPPCLSSFNNPYIISEYLICKKLSHPQGVFEGFSSEEVLTMMNQLHQKGVENFMFSNNDGLISQVCKNYEKLNQRVFRKRKIDIEIQLNEYEQPKNLIAVEKESPPNKKHLKALGYNWQRQQFNYQPETVFGYLLGHFDSKEKQTSEDRKLRQTLCKYYQKQKQTIQEVNEYLVDSMYLLGRKGLQNMNVSTKLLELRSLNEEIRNLVVDLQSYVGKIQNFQVQNIEERKKDNKENKQNKENKESREDEIKIENKSDEKREEKKKSRMTKSEEKHKDRHHSRSREKKKKKRSSSSQKEQKKKHEKTDDNKKKQKHSELPKEIKNEPSHLEENPPSVQSSLPSDSLIKRRRGRPRGSKNKIKPQQKGEPGLSKKEQLQQKKQLKRKQKQEG